MTLGAITVTLDEIQGRKPQAPIFAIRLSFAGDDSYPTGGTATFTALVRAAIETYFASRTDANVRGRQNFSILALIAGDCGQYVPSFDDANDKLFVRDGGHATWDEVGNGTNLSTTTFNVTAVCH